ncbi:phosphohistidine phosphatase SixA [Candidiatus Paracoxiella cheracis]|uniref:phosphohistidine phosphatase SixA n=1 Tax=Candidiatus Paracoxiella cheracis TaxID=3405120 RepID=UPI003BF5B4E5
MKLYCVRHGHAESEPDTKGERPLNEQGKQEVAKVAEYLAHRGVHVSHIMHSGKLRAEQTALILANAVMNGQSVEATDLLEPSRAVTPLVEILQNWHDDTMLVGHMPFMSQLVSALILNDDGYNIVRFPPGTIVCLEQYEHRWILNWILRPDLLPDED